MSLAIHTKYFGPTDKKQSRVKAIVRRDNLVSFTATVNRAVDPNSYLIEGDGKRQWFKAHASWQALDMAKAAGFDESKGFRVIETIQGV